MGKGFALDKTQLYFLMFGVHLFALVLYLLFSSKFRWERLKNTLFSIDIVKQDVFVIWLGIILTLWPAQLIATKMYIDDMKNISGPPGGFFFYGVVYVPFFWFVLSNLFSSLILWLKHRGESLKKFLIYVIKNSLRSIFFFIILFFSFLTILNILSK